MSDSSINGLLDNNQSTENPKGNGLLDGNLGNNGLIEGETPTNPDYPEYEIRPPNVGNNDVDLYDGKVFLKEGFKIWTTNRGDEIKATLNEDGSSTLVDMKFGDDTIKVMKMKTTLLKVIEKLKTESDAPLIQKYLFDVEQSVRMYDNIFNFMFNLSSEDLADTD